MPKKAKKKSVSAKPSKTSARASSARLDKTKKTSKPPKKTFKPPKKTPKRADRSKAPSTAPKGSAKSKKVEKLAGKKSLGATKKGTLKKEGKQSSASKPTKGARGAESKKAAPKLKPATQPKQGAKAPKTQPVSHDKEPSPKPKSSENGKFPAAWLKKQHERLLTLRDNILDSMNGVAKDALRERAEGSEANAFGMHQADAGSDAYDRDFALSLLSQEQDALYEIDEAIKRLESGNYGICEMSNKRIPRERLEAIPFARYTVECQSQIERQQKATRIRQPVTSLFGLSDDEGADTDEDESPAPEKSEA